MTGDVRFVIRATGAAARKAELEELADRAMRSPLGWPMAGAAAVDPFGVDYRGMHEGRTE